MGARKFRLLATCFLFLGVTVLLAGDLCASEQIPLFVSIQPQKFVAERIGGEFVSVAVLVPAGREPATYAPSVHQIAQLAKARIWFTIGVPFEDALRSKISPAMPKLCIVNSSRGIKKREIGEDSTAHEFTKEEAHEHSGLDPHVWLDPLNVIIIATNIRDELSKVDPAHENEFRRNYEALVAELNTLNSEIARTLAPLKGRTIFVFHPAFGYFCARYGLRQEAIETGGQSPRPALLGKLIKEAQKEGVRVIFVQPQFDQSAARKIAAAINGAVVSLDPLAENYLENLRAMCDAVAAGLAGQSK